MPQRKIGEFSQKIIDTLTLNVSVGTPIYIGDSNIEHIKSRHPYEFEKYIDKIEEIISKPDYIGQNPHDSSILFVPMVIVMLKHYIYWAPQMPSDTLKKELWKNLTNK